MLVALTALKTMSLRKKAIKEWPDEKAKKFLNQQYPGEKIQWVTTFEDSLYAHKTDDGSEFMEMDDDELRVVGIIEFIKRNGGIYESH